MKNSNKIPYDDNASYAAEEWGDDYYYWGLDLPPVYSLVHYSYEEYLGNHKIIINSSFPFYSFQKEAVSRAEFMGLKEMAIRRGNEIDSLNDPIYLETITKLVLNPIQRYTFELYENDLESSSRPLIGGVKLKEQGFNEIKKRILNHMISKKMCWPDIKEQKQFLDQMIPGGYVEDFCNYDRLKDLSKDENREDAAIEFLKKNLKALEKEHR